MTNLKIQTITGKGFGINPVEAKKMINKNFEGFQPLINAFDHVAQTPSPIQKDFGDSKLLVRKAKPLELALTPEAEVIESNLVK